MRRLIAILTLTASAATLPVVLAAPAMAVTAFDCVLGFGFVIPDPASQTRWLCYGGRSNNQPVSGLLTDGTPAVVR
ncbi:hypothetical protein [Nonomuraea candida]|uniref:hypothetical protein n=1 Tax=Nonomuraea candida TaxID=359159 RepID=UPI0005BAAC86|nr:hypothetical protein [Nonomuraea candida]